MRFLVDRGDGKVRLEEYYDNSIPPYAILSHTWGPDGEEVTFKDVMEDTGKNKAGYRKIEFCRKQAVEDGIQHFWVDTCCINKANHAELSEAINSMFRWYRNAKHCYVYLSDVLTSNDTDTQLGRTWETAFRNSRWFTRGWTLQELIAPRSVKFFSHDEKLLGDKKMLEQQIQEITGVPVTALAGSPLTEFTVRERLSWTEKRNTKRKEDHAYCLLGIFNIFIPLIYGEGDHAFVRLKEEIEKRSGKNKTDMAVGRLGDHRSRTSHPPRKRDFHVLRMLKTSDYEGAKSSLARRVNGTCEWFVENLDYKRWFQTTTIGLLWYSADPGCGKTVLARYLVDEVYGAKPLALYFFFEQRVRHHNALSTALCAILHQLYRFRPHLLQYAEKVYQQLGRRLVSEPVALWRLFQESVANSCEEILCILDAFDELELQESKVLSRLLLEEHCPPFNGTGSIKFLITSRPYYQIQQLFLTVGTLLPVFRITGEAEGKSISQDVETFIHGQVLRLDLEPKERLEVENKLLQKQNHDQTFLWGFLITEQLRANPPSTHKKLLAVIDQLPPTVHEAYEAILKNCVQIRKARKILSIIVAARQPLTLHQMDSILALEPQVKRLEDLDLEGPKRLAENIRHICGLFVKVADSKIYLIHQTAQDFLLCNQITIPANISDHHKKLSWQRSIVKSHSHFELASACIQFLSLEDMVCRSASRHPSTKSLHGTSPASNINFDTSNVAADKNLTQVKAFAAYAKANWTFHVVETLRYVQACHQVLSIERLLGLGLDLQMLDADGKSMLHHAIGTETARIDMELVQCILHHGGLVNRADHDNMTCMHYAVLRCNQTLIMILHQAGFDINEKVGREPRSVSSATSGSNDLNSSTQASSDQYGLTPLHAAAFFGREDILPYIIQQGADVNAQDEYGQTPIHLALRRQLYGPELHDLWDDDVLMVEHVWDYDEECTDGILSEASEVRLSIVAILCENPAFNPNLSNKHGQTPLHTIQYSRERTANKMVDLLVQKGANGMAADETGNTPIHVASRAGNVESLAILVKNPEDLNLRDKEGRNALHLAARSGNEDAVLFVLQKAASLDLYRTTDMNGRNALHHALHSEWEWGTHARHEVLNMLLREGVSAAQEDLSGMDPLAYYITNLFWAGQSEIISFLLAAGSNLHFQDELGRNLAHHLMRTLVQVDLKALKELETWGMHVQIRDQEGKTILHHAAISGSVSVAMLRHLRFCHQLDLATRDDTGMTAMEYADKQNQHLHHRHVFRPDRWKETIAAFTEVDNIKPDTQDSCLLQQEKSPY